MCIPGHKHWSTTKLTAGDMRIPGPSSTTESTGFGFPDDKGVPPFQQNQPPLQHQIHNPVFTSAEHEINRIPCTGGMNNVYLNVNNDIGQQAYSNTDPTGVFPDPWMDNSAPAGTGDNWQETPGFEFHQRPTFNTRRATLQYSHLSGTGHEAV